MKKSLFTFVAILIAVTSWSQTNTVTTIDSVGVPHHYGVNLIGHIFSPINDTIWFEVHRSLDGQNFVDTVLVDVLHGQGMAIPFNIDAPLVPGVINWIRIGTYQNYSSSVSYDTIMVLAPDTPQVVTLVDFQQISSTGNSVTGVISWTGGDTISTLIIENGHTLGYLGAQITLPITGSGSDTITVPATNPNSPVYLRAHVETPGFISWSNQLLRTFQTGSVIPFSIIVNVLASENGLNALATINVTVGDCGPLTLVPTQLENGNLPGQVLPDTVFTTDGVWTFPITMNQFGTSYSLEVTATGNCAPVTEVANFTSPAGSPFMIISHGAVATSPTTLTVGASFDPGDMGSGMFSITITRALNNTVHQAFPGIVYAGPSSRTENSVNLNSAEWYVVRYVYSDPSGTLPDVVAIDSILMPNVPVPIVMFQGAYMQSHGAFSQTVEVNVMGSGNASTATMFTSLRLTNPSQNEGQTSVPSITLSNPVQTVTRKNLLAGGTYRLKVWAVNQGGTSDTLYRDITIMDATNPNLFLQSFTEVPGTNQVRSVVKIKTNGNQVELEYTVFRNSGQNFDHGFMIPLGSSADTIITIVHDPVYANCDQVQMQVGGFIPSGLFSTALPVNNLQTVVIINEASCANSIEENFWEATLITSEGISFPQGATGNVQIVDMMGRVVDTQLISRKMNFSKTLTRGIYTVTILTNTGDQYSKKLVLGQF